MFDKQRVQSLINLNLSKFFSFREHVTSISELEELTTMVFKTMAQEVRKRHEVSMDEYLTEVKEALMARNKEDKRLSHEFWTAQAEVGWAIAFPDEYVPMTGDEPFQ